MKSAGGEFLAGAGFAQQQDWVGGWGDECQLAVECLHGGAAAGDFGAAGFESRKCFTWFLLKSAVDNSGEGVQVKGFNKVFEGTFGKRAGCRRQVSEGRHNDDREAGVLVFPCCECGKSVEAREANVDGYEIGLKGTRADVFAGMFNGTGGLDIVAGFAERFSEAPAE
jgi:hypothetical protein